MAQSIDWPALRTAAKEAMRKAYVPYSHYPVGAAALTDSGEIISGCNIENASYGVTLCAECSLITALIMGGGGRLVAFTCCDKEGNVIMPCGRCRQLLSEHGGPTLQVETVNGIKPMTEVLPDAWGVEDMERVSEND